MRIKRIKKTIRCEFFVALLFFVITWTLPNTVMAESKTEQLQGTNYLFEEKKGNYEFSGSAPSSSVVPVGTVNISGNFKEIQSDDTVRYDLPAVRD